jgi:hypothetical protein
MPMMVDENCRCEVSNSGVVFLDAPREDVGRFGPIFARLQNEIHIQKRIIHLQKKEISQLTKENLSLEQKIFKQAIPSCIIL